MTTLSEREKIELITKACGLTKKYDPDVETVYWTTDDGKLVWEFNPFTFEADLAFVRRKLRINVRWYLHRCYAHTNKVQEVTAYLNNKHCDACTPDELRQAEIEAVCAVAVEVGKGEGS